MRFVYEGAKWVEPNGHAGVVTELAKHAFNEWLNQWLLEKISNIGSWLVTSGMPLLSELFLVWGMACLCISISGSGKWLERGVKSVLISIGLGLVKYAV